MKKAGILLLFVAVLSACSSMKTGSSGTTLALEGKIEKIGMTTYQYGTHILKMSGKSYALKSSSLNLDTYVDQQVSLKGQKVEGYPLENGPDLIDVTEVVVK